MPVALAIPLALIALFLAAYGSALIAHHTSSGWVGWLAEKVGSIPLFGPLTIKQVVRLDEWIASAVKPAFDYADGKIAAFISYIGQVSSYGANHGYRNSLAMHNAFAWLLHVHEPTRDKVIEGRAAQLAAIKAGKMTPLGARSRYAAKAYAAATLASTEAAILRKLAHDPTWRAAVAADLPLARPIPGVKGGMTKAEIDEKIHAYVKAALAAAGLALPFPIPGKPIAIPKKQAKENADVNKRLRRLEKLLGLTGLAGLIGATFGKEIERFLRCKNTRGIAKAWCGADLNSLLGLLGGLVALEATFDLTAFAKEIQGGVTEAEGLVRHFWRADIAGPARDRQLGSAT